jgi:hypothetical protein
LLTLLTHQTVFLILQRYEQKIPPNPVPLNGSLVLLGARSCQEDRNAEAIVSDSVYENRLQLRLAIARDERADDDEHVESESFGVSIGDVTEVVLVVENSSLRPLGEGCVLVHGRIVRDFVLVLSLKTAETDPYVFQRAWYNEWHCYPIFC